jgi:branched chain amino acid efflux pump
VLAPPLLVALIADAALAQRHGFAGWGRPAGVLVGGVLALRRAPFPVLVAAAVAITASLRLDGVPRAFVASLSEPFRAPGARERRDN